MGKVNVSSSKEKLYLDTIFPGENFDCTFKRAIGRLEGAFSTYMNIAKNNKGI